MRNVEIAFIFLALASIILRLFSIEGGVLLSTFSFTMLSLIYLLFSFLLLNGITIRGAFSKNAYSHLNWNRLLWSVGTGISLSIAAIGVLFALNRWGGALLVLRLGTILLLVVSAVSLIKYILKPSSFLLGILIRCSALIIASVLLLLFWP